MTATVRRRPWAALVLAVLALAAVMLVRPPHAPPLYDGLGFPDEPYRWVVPPPGERKTPQAPTTASASILVTGGVSDAGGGFSAEQGPQIAFAVAKGAFAAPSTASAVKVTAAPVAVPPQRPDRGQVVSNLYRITATADGGSVGLARGADLVVNLRANKATDQNVVISTWDGAHWAQVPTRQAGQDIYGARLYALLPIAAVRLDPGVTPTVSAAPATLPATPGAPGGGGQAVEPTPGGASGTAPGVGPGAAGLWLPVGGIAVLLAIIVLLARRRTAATTDDGDADTDADSGGIMPPPA